MKTEFVRTFERVSLLFRNCPDPHLVGSAGGWSVIEILGHLVDSASNNYQRIQRYIPGGELEFPGYDQEGCVRRSNYGSFDYRRLLDLWYNHNKLLFHLYDSLPRQELASKIKVGDNPATSITALMADYFAHMKLHEEQVREILATESGTD
jgi:hypothetical protein